MIARLFLLIALQTGVWGAEVRSLLSVLTAASRPENRKDSLRYLETARELLSQGAAVNEKDLQGRTALHWAVIGSMYARGHKHQQAYLELVDLLLSRGADVNAEDSDANTPLDWQEVSPHVDIMPLLQENGARHGLDETERLNSILETVSAAVTKGDLGQARSALHFDLPAGAELSIRLTTAVGSHISRSGDPVEAVVIAPVLAEGRTVISPGTKLRGTVLLAQQSANDYERSNLILDFARLTGENGAETRVAVKVADVDNARESVQAGRIIGLAHPNYGKLTWGVRMAGFANPIASYALQSAIFLRDREYKREIIYPAGVEMTLTVLVPGRVTAVTGPVWPLSPASAELTRVALEQPVRTATPDGTVSDLINLMFVGSRQRLEAALQEAGWIEAGKLGLTSGLKTFIAIAENKGYKAAPVSLLLLEGQTPDLAYQKQNNTFAKRHHMRIWKRPQLYQGREVWVASATHDIGIASHRERTQWYHRIDSRIDRERAKVTHDLLFSSLGSAHSLIDRPAAPRQSMNATGDQLRTDGRLAVVMLY